MQLQKDDEAPLKTDVFLENKGSAHKNAAKLGQTAMHGMQLGHAACPIASQLQHDYLGCIEGK